MPIGITKLPHRHAKITKERIWGRDVAPELDQFQGRLHKLRGCCGEHAKGGWSDPGHGVVPHHRGRKFADRMSDGRFTLLKWKAVRQIRPLLETQWRYA